MYGKIALVLAFAAVALSAEYPAGVHPAVCPNYPYCDVNILARFTPGGIPIPEYGWGRYGYPYLRAVAPIADNPAGGAKYPAGLDPASCPNYPFCS